MPGDKGRNPRAAENISYIEEIPHIRYKFNAKPGQIRNPYGRAGYKGNGLEKPMAVSKKEYLTTMEARELQDLARQRARKAMDVYDKILDSDTAADTAKIAAAKEILDRGFGKATQTNVNTQVNADGKPTEIDDRALNDRINQAIQRIEAVTSGEGEAPSSEERSAHLRKLN